MAPDLKLNSFFKGNLDEEPGVALQALMRAILIRTQFLPTVRHVIGWRGLKQLPAVAEGWTAKVTGCAGVFGLFFSGVDPFPGWTIGRFGLCYFPDAAEALVERCSVRAAAITQDEGYRDSIRDFLQHPAMCDLFGVGSLLLSVRSDRRALALVLESASALRTVAVDGVRLPQDGCLMMLVDPGGFDQDFPAFETARRFFDVLAASVSFNLEQAPGFFTERRSPATQQAYDDSGAQWVQDAPELWNAFLAIGYGEADFDAFCSQVAATGISPIAAATATGPETAPGDYQDKLWWRAHRLKDSKSIDKKLLGVDERPPLIILTGFLGCGKTSFLQHFIEYQTQRSRFVAVIQNEIGEIGLDGKLLDYTVTEIDEGCVCCTLAGNLKRAVQGILGNFSPDYIILETSGLSNPFNLIEDMAALGEVVRFDSTVSLVDAVNLNEALAGGPIAADQIRAADVVIVNKRDLVDDARLEAVYRKVKEINPAAPLFCTTHGDLNPALIFDMDASAGLGATGLSPATESVLEKGSSVHPAHAAAGLWSKSLRLSHALDREKFLQVVRSLPPSVFRAKGLLDFEGSDETMLFQCVCGRFDLSVFPKQGIRDRFLTFIGSGDEPNFQHLIEAMSMAPTRVK
ncbi:MAG: GTP-binding protein [Desulfobacterales bacterium]